MSYFLVGGFETHCKDNTSFGVQCPYLSADVRRCPDLSLFVRRISEIDVIMLARMVYISYICVMQKHTLPPCEGGF